MKAFLLRLWMVLSGGWMILYAVTLRDIPDLPHGGMIWPPVVLGVIIGAIAFLVPDRSRY